MIAKRFKFRATLLLMIIMVLAINACTLNQQLSLKDQKFRDLYPGIQMEGFARIKIVDTGAKDFKNAMIQNVSKEEILFPQMDTALQFFIYDNQAQTWHSVKDQKVCPDCKDFILYPDTGDKNDDKWFEVITISPELVFQGKPIEVRVVSVGETIRDNKPTGKKVGAYTDTVFEP